MACSLIGANKQGKDIPVGDALSRANLPGNEPDIES